MSDDKKLDKLILLVQNISKDITSLKEEVASLKELVSSRDASIIIENNIKPLKEEDFTKILENKTIKRHLAMKAPGSELKLFKRIYSTNTAVPIKINKNKVICYYNGKSWVDDETGEAFLKIFLNNVSRMYTQENTLKNVNSDFSKFLENQGHIKELREEKIRKKLLSQIIKAYK